MVLRSVAFARDGRATALIAASVSAATALGVVASLRVAALGIGFCIHDAIGRQRRAQRVRLLLAVDRLLDGLHQMSAIYASLGEP